jgi:hypothetical protein
MMVETKSSNDPLQKQKLQLYSTEIMDKIVYNIDLTSNSTKLFGDSVFAGQIYKSSDFEQSLDMAIQNNLPIFNMTECEVQLKQKYNLNKDSEIIYVTSMTDRLMNIQNKTSYNILAYENKTKQKLDLTYCNKTSTVEMPLTNTSMINLTLYKVMKEQGIDIFNPDDPIFNDICVSYNDNNNLMDTTLNWRRQNLYQQKRPMCIGFNCTYKSINEFNYIKCSCSELDSQSSIINTLSDVLMSTLSEINISIVTCYKQIPSVSFFNNIGCLEDKYWIICEYYILLAHLYIWHIIFI